MYLYNIYVYIYIYIHSKKWTVVKKAWQRLEGVGLTEGKVTHPEVVRRSRIMAVMAIMAIMAIAINYCYYQSIVIVGGDGSSSNASTAAIRCTSPLLLVTSSSRSSSGVLIVNGMQYMSACIQYTCWCTHVEVPGVGKVPRRNISCLGAWMKGTGVCECTGVMYQWCHDGGFRGVLYNGVWSRCKHIGRKKIVQIEHRAYWLLGYPGVHTNTCSYVRIPGSRAAYQDIIHMRNLLGWLETRLIQNYFNYLQIDYITLKIQNLGYVKVS